jgi:hypothetical protein
LLPPVIEPLVKLGDEAERAAGQYFIGPRQR